MRRWSRRLALVLSPFALFAGCAVASSAIIPDPVAMTAISARVRVRESAMVDEARAIIANPDSLTTFDNLQRPIVARRDGLAVVGWRWVDGIPAKSYGPVYDPDGLIGRYRDRLMDGVAFTGCTPLFGVWWYCRLY